MLENGQSTEEEPRVRKTKCLLDPRQTIESELVQLAYWLDVISEIPSIVPRLRILTGEILNIPSGSILLTVQRMAP